MWFLLSFRFSLLLEGCVGLRINDVKLDRIPAEIPFPGRQCLESAEHNFSRLHRGLLRREGRESSGDQIRVNKLKATRILGKKPSRERCFTGAIGTSDDIEVWMRHQAILHPLPNKIADSSSYLAADSWDLANGKWEPANGNRLKAEL